jgi:hypothetical protein
MQSGERSLSVASARHAAMEQRTTVGKTLLQTQALTFGTSDVCGRQRSVNGRSRRA